MSTIRGWSHRALQANRAQLDAFAASLGRLELKVYEGWREPEKIAFLINAYNALTLEAILANYPIKPSVTGAMLYPGNSIRQIPGVWDKLEFQLLGKPATLDVIEHQMLRKQFNEPRIHMALVCASIGCPTLRNEPYVAERLSEQLDDQTRKFLSDPLKFRIDRQARVVHLSPLFKWYGGDFVKSFGTDKFAGHSDAERAALNYFSALLEPADREFLEKEKFEIKYLDYDWSLNEQGGAH
ncbi:MAG: DUF547 domain-containing protein [Acidobacteria bacterium]|nr:DUF547 domain-containing protein [Acidobacteriota bacterium]